MVDRVLLNAVKGISDLINNSGMVNVDFADVRAVMSERGKALMGIGKGTGKNRAVDAAMQAITSPLLEDASIDGARGILINITSGYDLTMGEMDEAASKIQERAHEDANIIVGSVLEADMQDEVHIMVIATGFDGVAAADAKRESATEAVRRRRQLALGYPGRTRAAQVEEEVESTAVLARPGTSRVSTGEMEAVAPMTLRAQEPAGFGNIDEPAFKRRGTLVTDDR